MSETLVGGGLNAGSSDPGNNAQAAAASGASDGGAAASGGAPAAPTVPEWASAFEGIGDLGEDILGDPSLKAIKDPTSLLKSYVHAQKKMGADKVVVPTKNSTEEEWLSFYHKLGMPTEFDAYGVNKPEQPVLDDTFTEDFRKMAYENKLLPEQAQQIYDFLSTRTTDEFSRQQTAMEEKSSEAINSLKEEWGEAFDQNIHTAKMAVNEFGGEDLKQYLNDTGLGNDPEIVKVFNKIGKEFFKEDNFKGESKPAYALSRDDAQKRIGEITGQMDGPYYNDMHPDHKRTVEEVSKLYQVLG